jgi:hypothetical protein
MQATAPHQPSAGGALPLAGGILRSEMCKLRTVRSTFWALAAAVTFNVSVAAVLAIVLPGHLAPTRRPPSILVRVSLGGLASCRRSPSACSACSPSPAYRHRPDPRHPWLPCRSAA